MAVTRQQVLKALSQLNRRNRMYITAGDGRFEIIAKAKADIIESTNIKTSEDEMKLLDSFLFRCWQMGWLDRYYEEKRMKDVSAEYRRMLKDQIKQAGQWLIDNADLLVSDVKGITDFQITINLKNGDSVPTIKIMQENAFWHYEKLE